MKILKITSTNYCGLHNKLNSENNNFSRHELVFSNNKYRGLAYDV